MGGAIRTAVDRMRLHFGVGLGRGGVAVVLDSAPALDARPLQIAGDSVLEVVVVGGERHRELDLAEDLGQLVEVVDAERQHLALGRDDLELGLVAPLGVGEHGHLAVDPGRVDMEDRPRPHLREGERDLALGRRVPLGLGRGLYQAVVLGGVPPGALAGGLGVAQQPSALVEPGFDRHHRPVGLVLGERQVQQVVGLLGRVAVHQVGGHVVGGSERRGQSERPAGRERRHLIERDERRPQHDRVAHLVDAPPSGPPGELGVVAGGEELVTFTGELAQLLDDDRPGRHVDAEGQRLGGEHHADQALGEAGLDRLLERRDHPGMVGGDAQLE
jgi:hypothetical protein